jgi:putative transposase
MLPQHFPPHQTVYRWFTRFRDDGTWEKLNHHLSLIPSFSLDMKESAGRRGDSGKNRRSAGGGISLRIRQATFAAA